jgi:hypothetical protein
MSIRWKVRARATAKGWTNPYQLAKGAGITQPLAARILSSEPIERIDVATLETLARAFRLKSPWSLLEYRPGEP